MRDLNMGTIGALLLFFLSIHFSLSAELDTLDPNTPLTDGETLVSAGGMFVLGFFSPRGSSSRYVGIWYNKVSVQTVVWVANRQHPIAGGSAGTLTISSMNGSLVVGDVSNSSTIVWFTPVNANVSNPIAQLLDDGNLVVREEGNKDPESYAWQSFDHPTDTLLPGMKLGWDLRKGINRNLTSWASESDPSPGTYTVAMDAHQGDPEFFMWSGGRRTWRSGPWNGLWLSGIPEMETYSNQFTFGFVSNADEVYYGYHIRNTTSIVSRFVVIPSGQTQRVVWIEASRAWNPYWFAPKDQCDSYSACGPYGVCSVDRSPICICLQGFDPKSPDKWALRDGTDGCVRRTALDCRNGTDGFVKIAGAKLPDTTAAVVDWSMSLDQCQTECLSNCSCKGYARANVSGSGCIIWTAEITDLRVYMYGEQDLYVRLAAADLDSTSNPHHKRSKATAAVLVISVVMALLIGCIAYRWKKRKQRARGSIPFRDHFHHESVRDSDGELRLFDLLDIIAATEDFSIGNKLGEGGFGPVYKGRMNDGQEIAVKRLAKTSMQGQDEFKNEVMLIAKLQHRNLVRLLGCCIHGDERMLVYEYMYNKSLDASLFGEVKHLMLDWKTRYNIILGVARGLLYLHQDSRLRIIHRDLKASNILLDKEMIPKISDFGIARIFGGDETEVNTRKVVGTYGYMSPEYAMDGVFSVKSDVFSFGVLVLEIVSGKKNRGVYQSKYQQNLLGHAWSLWKDGNGHKLVDDSLACSFSMSEALRCIEVGLLCVQERPEDRPIMLSVVAMLGNDNMPSSPPKQPGFVAARGPIESDSSASKNKSLDMNVLSSSILEGR